MKDRLKFEEKFKNSEVVYFKNEFEDALIKYVPGEGYYVKFPGKKPFLQQIATNRVVYEGFLEANEIAQEEYEA